MHGSKKRKKHVAYIFDLSPYKTSDSTQNGASVVATVQLRMTASLVLLTTE